MTTFLPPDWITLCIPPGQGSATLLTTPFLAGARRGLGTRLDNVCILYTYCHSKTTIPGNITSLLPHIVTSMKHE